ncbi:MAG: zinc ribbon domain-containing protein [Ferrimicrobium acidiphilum]
MVYVDPVYTSQQRSGCRHVDMRNCFNQATFVCTNSGLSPSADRDAAINIAKRCRSSWVVSRAALSNTTQEMPHEPKYR